MPAFLALLFAYIMSQFYRSFLAIVAGDFSRDLGFGPTELGLLSAVWFAAFAFAQFPIGAALDRHGPRRTIAVFMISAVAGAGLLAAAQSLAASLIAMALIGIGCGPILMGSLVYFTRKFSASRFAVLTGILIGIGSFGGIASASPLALAVQTFGWRATILATGALTLLAAGAVYVFVADLDRVGDQKNLSAAGALRQIAGNRALWPMLPLVFISYSVVIAERSLWIGPYFEKIYTLTVLERGQAALAMSIVMSAGALAYGPMERFFGGPKTPALSGSLVAGAGFVLLALWPQVPMLAAVSLLCIIGFAGMTYGTLMTHARFFIPPHLTGRGVTFLNFLFIGGAGLVQAISGPFLDYAGRAGGSTDVWRAAPAFNALHLAFGIALLAASVIYVRMRAKLDK